MNLNRRRDISTDRQPSRDTSMDQPILPELPSSRPRPSDESDSSDSDSEAGNYVRLTMPTPPPTNRSASRQTSSESCSSVFERGTTPRSSNTSQGRPSYNNSGFTRINYSDASPHYSPVAMHQPLLGHHSSPVAHRNNSPNSSSLTSGEANDYVNVNWKPVDEVADEPPPRPPRPTRLDIKNQPNCSSTGQPPKTQPRVPRSQASTPISDDARSRFSPGGSPPPTMNLQKTLLTIEVEDKLSARKPAVPPKPCPGPGQSSSFHSTNSEFL